MLHVAAREGYASFLNYIYEPRGLAELHGIAELRDEETRTALHMAAQYRKKDIAALLIQKYRADITARTLKGQKQTALHLAAAEKAKYIGPHQGLRDTVALLLRESNLQRQSATDTEE